MQQHYRPDNQFDKRPSATPGNGFDNLYSERLSPVSETEELPHSHWTIRVMRIAVRYAAIWLAIFLLLKFVIPSYDVKGSSMEPTYQAAGDRVLTDHLIFQTFGKPERGDIVVLERPVPGEDALIKRVVGLPGEQLEIQNGVVFINGKRLVESYIVNHGDYNYQPVILPHDCYFVLGDNRPVSLDSHYFGCVSRSKIIARVLMRYPWHT